MLNHTEKRIYCFLNNLIAKHDIIIIQIGTKINQIEKGADMMWGAIIGDLAGSIYEYGQIKKISHIEIKNLIPENSFFSDDTILTIAILDAILNNNNYEYYLKQYIKEWQNYKPNYEPYFKTPFSKGTMKWALQNTPGNSRGNGAMMRISPVAYLYNNYSEVILHAHQATIPSHNFQEAITCATLIAKIIYLARKQYSKESIQKKINMIPVYQEFSQFNTTCQETINNCLYAIFTTSSFEEALQKIISFGGDTDTNACIVGSIAESIYGIDPIYIEQAKQKLPKQFIVKLEQGYTKVKRI